METMIVYVDDVEHARTILSPLVPTETAYKSGKGTHWVIVACVPAMPNDAGKWASAQAMQLWRDDWANTTLDQLKPLLSNTGGTITPKLADHKISLVEQTSALLKLYNDAKVLDARRPKFGQDMQPVTTEQPQGKKKLAGLAAAVTVATVLAADF